MQLFINLFTLLRLCFIISKYQIITHTPKNITIPIRFKILGYCLYALYPVALIWRPKLNYGARLHQALKALGPIYIKFGQALSTRPDFIGNEIAQELSKLQDKMPAFASNIATEQIEKELEIQLKDKFKLFSNKPVAAASIAQVHKAILHSGEEVAVKILRPNIKELYARDILLLEFLARMAERLTRKFQHLKPKEVISVFKKTMQHELDMLTEAAAASRMKDNFANDKTVKIPKVYWDLTTNSILVTEWISGVSIYEDEAIAKINLPRVQLSANLAVMFFNQAYRDGFFHADLHPGNILVCSDGKIALVDFGIVGILPEKDRFVIAEVLYAFLARDYMRVAELHLDAGYVPTGTDLELFSMRCRAVAEPIIGKKLRQISIGKLLAKLFAMTEEFGMETQPQLIMLQKSIVIVEGIGKKIDNDINMWELARPWIKKWAAKNISPEAKMLRYFNGVLKRLMV